MPFGLVLWSWGSQALAFLASLQNLWIGFAVLTFWDRRKGRAQDGQFGAPDGQVGAQNAQFCGQDDQFGVQDGQLAALDSQLGAQDGQVGAQDGQFGAHKKSAGNYKSVVPASMKALCNEMRGAEESMQNIPRSPPQPNPACPKTLQNGGPGRPWTPKCTQEAPQTGQEMPKRAQDAPKKHPRSVQEEPRDAQERPRATPESPRTLQNGARQIQRPVFSTILVGSFVRKAPGVILFGLLFVRQACDL